MNYFKVIYEVDALYLKYIQLYLFSLQELIFCFEYILISFINHHYYTIDLSKIC